MDISTPIEAYQFATVLLRIANIQRVRLQEAFGGIRGVVDKLRNEGEKAWD